MRRFAFLLAFLLLCAPAWADTVSCATGSQSAATITALTALANNCQAGQTYGLTTTSTATFFLAADGNRSCILIQNPPANGTNVCIAWTRDGTTLASLTAPQNCFTLTPGQPFYEFNLAVANNPARIFGSALSVVSSAPSSIVFQFCQ